MPIRLSRRVRNKPCQSYPLGAIFRIGRLRFFNWTIPANGTRTCTYKVAQARHIPAPAHATEELAAQLHANCYQQNQKQGIIARIAFVVYRKIDRVFRGCCGRLSLPRFFFSRSHSFARYQMFLTAFFSSPLQPTAFSLVSQERFIKTLPPRAEGHRFFPSQNAGTTFCSHWPFASRRKRSLTDPRYLDGTDAQALGVAAVTHCRSTSRCCVSACIVTGLVS